MEAKHKVMIVAGIVLAVALIIGISSAATAAKKQRDRALSLASQITFNPRPFTDSIFNDLYVSWTSDTGLYSELAKIPDDHLRLLFIDWEEHQRKKKENKNRTLANALYAGYSGWSWNWSSVEPFYQRLKNLGLE